MSKAVSIDRWDRTAILKQTLINLKVDKKDRVSFEDCHPFTETELPYFEEIKHQVINGNGFRR